EVDTTETIVNETVNMKVTVSGQGNIENIPDPAWPDNPEWRAFDSQTTTESSYENGILSGVRTYERTLVPTQAGNFTLPAVQFSYFDPELARYQTVSTQDFTIHVTPDQNAAVPVQPVANNDLSLSNSAIMALQPLKSSVEANSGKMFTQQIGYWLLWLLPLALLIGHYSWDRRQKRLNDNPQIRRSQQAAKKANQAIKSAQKNPEGARRAAGHILSVYLADKLNHSVSGLTYNEIAGLLASMGLDAELIDQVRNVLILSEMGQYAPGGSEPQSEDLLNETKRLIDQLEAVL
ncbi:MAG: BatD family protein, partial [Anaerolineales bacterium]|nr:BatD family protein [Anaerolineales bacterium]